MIPILFEKTATSFTTNGIGRLSDAAKCTVTEERNGQYELTMDYPMTGLHFSDLINDRIILAKPAQNAKLQAFRIYKTQKKAKDLAQISARHISYQLSFVPVKPSFTATSAASALSGLKSHAAENCPFIFSSNVSRSGTFVVEQPDSLRALLGGQDGSVLDIFHGEYEWDNFNVRLYESRGSDKGVTIVYGKNLIDLTQEENIENTVTGIYPYWKTDGGQTTDGHTIYSGTTAEWNKETELVPNENDVYIYTDHEKVQEADGTIKYLPGYKVGDGTKKLSVLAFLSKEDPRLLTAVTYIDLDEKVVYSDKAGNFPYKRSVVKDFTQEFDNTPSQQQLRDYTKQYIKENNIGMPEVSLDVKFLNLFETPGYKDVAQLQTVNLCDTVTVVFPKLGISAKAKVNKTEYDVLKERYNEIGIGDSKSSFTGTISDQLKQVSYMPTSEDMKGMIDRATGVLNAGYRGHVVINRNAQGYANEILFLDSEDINRAKNVIRINMNGIGFSSTGYVGPYYQSWTNDGHLTLGGINNSYGTLEIMDEEAQPTLMVDKEGLKLLALAYVGYYRNEKFYEDKTFTKELPKKKNKGYYDRITSTLYKWNGSSFVQDSTAGVIARMTHDGLEIKQGKIELLMNEEVGFKADGDEIYLGDFFVSKEGRHIFQSKDYHTGMSGGTGRDGQLYFWADWVSTDDYGLVVNRAGAYVMSSDRENRYHVGDALQKLFDGKDFGGGTSCPSYSGGGGGGCGTYGGGGSCDGNTCYCGCDGDCSTNTIFG